MAKFDEVLQFLARIQPLIKDGTIEMDDQEEEVERKLVGGSHSKKTGDRVVVIKIPYSLQEDYLLQQLHFALERKKELTEENNVMDASIARIKEIMADIKKI